MVWPFTSKQDPQSRQADGDPLRELDPSLREFLQRESPVKYTPTVPTAESSPLSQGEASSSATSSSSLSQRHQKKKSSESNSPLSTKIPTLFPEDNRYAHLWKTYTPLSELTEASASPQEKLSDVLNGYKDRKASIGRAALENCADEQWAQSECWHGGTLKQRMTLCRDEVRKLERCYVMNSRFLKALGYLSVWDRPAEVEERIQMHADKLYHEMLERERAAEDARKRGDPVPTFGKLIPDGVEDLVSQTAKAPARSEPTGNGRSSEAKADTSTTEPRLPTVAEELAPNIREKFRERLKKLGPVEREIEERAIAREIQAALEVNRSMKRVIESNAQEKKQRVEKGEATIGDRIGSLFGR